MMDSSDGTGSTRWFVLTAVVTQRIRDIQMVECLNDTRNLIGKAPKSQLHFSKMKHEHRVPYIRRIGNLNIRIINVAVYKPSLHAAENFQRNKNRLYRYTTRYLVERISWLLNSARRRGNRSTEIIFSDRASLSYDEIRSYLTLLLKQAETNPDAVQIDGNVVDPCHIRSVQHSQLAGLQVADAAATSAYYAINPNRYDEIEPAYFAHLATKLYRRKGKVLGYGMKFWPENYEAMKRKIPQIEDLEDFLN